MLLSLKKLNDLFFVCHQGLAEFFHGLREFSQAFFMLSYRKEMRRVLWSVGHAQLYKHMKENTTPD